jgi:cysteine desulfurase/selenocysteine lyase
MLDVNKIRADFPILQEEAYPGVPLVYLDSAASSQKPLPVIEAMNQYYRRINANVHRGIHRLSEEATNAYEGARERITRFINAADSAEVIYVRNATEAFNLVAYSWGRANLQPGDEILITAMEHHANIVPWQIMASRRARCCAIYPFCPTARWI